MPTLGVLEIDVGKRLVKSPKIFVRDSGVTHALLGTEESFYRASGGAEIDLILALPGREPWAIEIKRSLEPGSKVLADYCGDNSLIRT